MDLEIVAGIQRFVSELGDKGRNSSPSIFEKREYLNEDVKLMSTWQDGYLDVIRKDIELEGTGRHLGRWYETLEKAQDSAAMLYIHGGGMIAGSVEIYDSIVARYVAESRVPMLSVEYRLAPESNHREIISDCEAALSWLLENSEDLGIRSELIGVMGDSAGAGIAAGLVSKVNTPDLLRISSAILIQPMLDSETNTVDGLPEDQLVWSVEDNQIGWSSYLGHKPWEQWAVPSHLEDLSMFPPTWIESAELDLFARENAKFALELTRSGIPTEFTLWPEVPHAFEWFNPEAGVVQNAFAARINALRKINQN